MPNPTRIFAFLAAEAAQGHRTALVTVIAVTGASVRNPGAHMAVSATGEHVGSLSGGCIETAVVAEALAAIAECCPREVRFGADSPFIDIRLPCGGSVDLLITPVEQPGWAQAIVDQQARRETVQLTLSRPDGSLFGVSHAPRLRIAILGQGASVEALATLARSIDAEVMAFTPDGAMCERLGPGATLLRSMGQAVTLPSDPWTAFAFFFHDHDWEVRLLAQALGQLSLIVGAMGSHKTHAARVRALQEHGISDDAIACIRAPIGLIPSSRDPETLALSSLAEIVAAYNAAEPTRVSYGLVFGPGI